MKVGRGPISQGSLNGHGIVKIAKWERKCGIGGNWDKEELRFAREKSEEIFSATT